MSEHKSWLWPDRTIGKRESRELRNEHNALVNSHEACKKLLNLFLWNYATLQNTEGAKTLLDMSGTYTAGHWIGNRLETLFLAVCKELGRDPEEVRRD